MYGDGEEGLERDMKKARHYLELGTIGGSINARFRLACLDEEDGDDKRAAKHFVICAKSGDEDSLNIVKEFFEKGNVTKDEYAEALRSYQKQHEDTKSTMRDEALAWLNANPSRFQSFSSIDD